MLEIARAFALSKNEYEHSIIFLLTTGEEEGLLGSTYYIDHPVVPLYQTIANINIDGLAMFDTFYDVIGIGAELSTLGDILEKVAIEQGMYVSNIPALFISSESFARSDQIAFAKAGIPSILVAEGFHYKNLTQDEGIQLFIDWQKHIYHTPFDDLNQPINFNATQQHCEFIFTFCHFLAYNKSIPVWKSGTPYINARLRSIAEKR